MSEYAKFTAFRVGLRQPTDWEDGGAILGRSRRENSDGGWAALGVV